MSARGPRKPIVIWCARCKNAGKDGFVQRFRWDVDQGHWIATDKTAEGDSFVPKSGGRPGARPPALFDFDSRQHVNARCNTCGDLVPMREGGAQIALNRLWDSGLIDVPLEALRRAYGEVPKVLR